jgi:hypothetical protein
VPPLDYEKPDDPEPRWLRLVLYTVAALAVVVIVVPAGCVTIFVIRTRIETRRFHAAFPESQILGQSVAAVRARYGKTYNEHHDGGTTFLMYFNPTAWEECAIEFHDDKATRVFFRGK